MSPLSPSDCLVLARHVIGEDVLAAHPKAELLPDGSDVVLHEKSGGGNPLFVRNIAIVSLENSSDSCEHTVGGMFTAHSFTVLPAAYLVCLKQHSDDSFTRNFGFETSIPHALVVDSAAHPIFRLTRLTH